MGNVFTRRRPTTNNAPNDDFSNINDESNMPTDVGDAQNVPTVQGGVGVMPTNAGDAQNVPPAVGVPITEAEVVASSTAPAPAGACTLTTSAEKQAVGYAEANLLAMISLKAPAAPNDVKRAPLDLVACIDRSGSMHGQKMRLMQSTLELLVKRAGLTAEDRLAFVTFDSQVRVDMDLERMDQAGRAKAEAVVRRIHAGSTTNLSGGALKAIDLLDASADNDRPAAEEAKEEVKKPKGRTRAVMLFTDGLANEGIKEPARLCAAVRGAITAASAKLGGPINLFSFGFGADHNEDALRDLATQNDGLYYYVSSADAIPEAFADCLGGLTSVVAQNASLSFLPTGGATIARVLGSTYTRDATGAIVLGDLFAEDEKDILVELTLPALAQPASEPSIVLTTTFKAFNIPRNAPEVIEAELRVARPAETPADQPLNTVLDEQRNRIEAAEAMAQAARMADQGDVRGGRMQLEACRRMIGESASAGATLSANLQAQLATIEDQFTTETQYRAVGSKMSKMSALSNYRQRGHHMDGGAYNAGAKRKMAMKASWGLSSSMAPADGSDSD